jgi:replicative DNA helicase
MRYKNSKEIFNVETEKYVLVGCLRFPTSFYEIEPFVSESEFVAPFNQVIFSVIKNQISKGDSVDPYIISEKIKNLGKTSFNQTGNIFDYIKSLSLVSITEKGFISAAQELKRLSIRREIFETAEKLQQAMAESSDSSLEELISKSDKIYNEKILSYDLTEDPVDIFEHMQEIIEEIGNAPKDDAGYLTPFADFNRLYGGLREKNLYAFVARPKNGKTTLLCDMTYKICNEIYKPGEISCLYLDTEMETLDVQKRLLASISGVPFWYIDTGNWRKSPEMTKTIREAWTKIKNFKFNHLKVGNKSTQEVISMARRWYYSKVGRGQKAVVVYDYLKMTGEATSDSWKEYQVIGDKTDKFKKLAEELYIPVVTSTQMNRSGEQQNKKSGAFSDDSSAIALSDRLQWFATYVGIFRRKTLDEIAEDGEPFGTHKLVTTASRFQGKDAAGHHDLVQREVDGEKKYVSNYISFDVKNFNVKEVGSLDKIINQSGVKYQIFDDEGRVASGESLL